MKKTLIALSALLLIGCGTTKQTVILITPQPTPELFMASKDSTETNRFTEQVREANIAFKQQYGL